VRFWVRGAGEPRHAFIHDVSSTGVFISTAYPLPRDTEIRIEIHDRDTMYTVEAVVARRVWVAPDLRKLGPTGMGARFLAPEELVARLRERGAGRVAGAKQHEDRFRIVLEDDRSMLQMYVRDLELGGLFIPTETPPALNRAITVDFVFPGSGEIFSVPARVVQRIPAGQNGNDLRAGAAVAFDDPAPLLERLRPFLAPPPSAPGPPPAAPPTTAFAADCVGQTEPGAAETTAPVSDGAPAS